MSGSGDYTKTPRLGLYKPNYALDVGQWGNHLNANADTLDAAWASDVINVLDKGADPTGVADSAPAFNAAAAEVASGTRRRAVYFPTGTYRVNSQINLTACQAFYGDSRGSSVLMVDQAFDPAATSVINVTASGYDAGPVLRDFGVTFQQPSDQSVRANFKTLAAGGTSVEGGTGVKYPWAITAGSDSFRIHISRVRIGGAWDGITSNNHNAVFWLQDIEMGALDCGLSLGEGTAILDACHISGYHFWNFDLNGTGPTTVIGDGQTIAARFGEVDGLDARGFMTIWGRVVFTTAAATGWYAFTNVFLDNGATLEIGAVKFLQISNVYCTAGPGTGSRPLIQANGNGTVQIQNLFATSSTLTQPILAVHSGDVFVGNMSLVPYNAAQIPVLVDGGTLRIGTAHIYPGTASAYTQPLIYQGGTGALQIASIDLRGIAGSSGVAIQFNTDASNMLGSAMLGSGWTINNPASAVNGFYGTLPYTRGQLQNSVTYANDAAAATGGVAIGQLYRNGSAVQVRVA